MSCSKSNLIYDSTQPEQPVFSESIPIKEFSGQATVDIVWVIDNSGSMGDEQDAIARNTDRFINEFNVKNNISWRMGILSTDENDPPFIGFNNSKTLINRFERGNPDPIGNFQAAVDLVGTRGGHEAPFQVAINAFKKDPNFLRKSAQLVVIIVSDEEDQSRLLTTNQFLSELLKLKNNKLEDIRVLGALTANEDVLKYPSNPECEVGYPTWNYAQSKNEEIIQLTNGQRYSLCAPDFGQKLSEIGQLIVDLVTSSKLLLTQRPIDETLKVYYKGTQLPRGAKSEGGLWYYSPRINSIVFYDLSFAPNSKENEHVKVSFDIDDGYIRN